MKSDPKDPVTPVDNPVVPTSPVSLLKIFFASIFIFAMRAGLSSFGAIVDWTKSPDMTTVHQVWHSLHAAFVLGSIQGVLTGLEVVAIVLLGGPLWSILGPFVAAVGTQIANFVGAVTSAFRNKQSDDKTGK
jgi:hypothetical protein